MVDREPKVCDNTGILRAHEGVFPAVNDNPDGLLVRRPEAVPGEPVVIPRLRTFLRLDPRSLVLGSGHNRRYVVDRKTKSAIVQSLVSWNHDALKVCFGQGRQHDSSPHMKDVGRALTCRGAGHHHGHYEEDVAVVTECLSQCQICQDEIW
ncbi:hypothetical protein AALO_G00083590 [Alosa alosa]|uniref:Uncharacterized protein n=1 Tax=Alosa alosa TaxID=278164 RepID=A0AAV6H1U5_9TELE|nr:hypothetical protein AALO_G00083590 [Alosa alosa]